MKVQILRVETDEGSPSVLISTEKERYMFNIGEGMQRMCTEHKVRMGKLNNIFLTQLTAETLGGLPGMILTTSDSGKSKLTVHGPDGIQQYLHATRHFLQRPNFQLDFRNVSQQKTNFVTDIEIRHVVHVASKKRDVQGEVKDSTAAVSYVCISPSSPGKFQLDKALAQGVPKGPLFGKLQRGQDITLPDGRLVLSSSCVSPVLPPLACIIVSCPSLQYIDTVCADESLIALESGVLVQLVIHLGSQQVLQDVRYREFIKKYGPNVSHVAVNHPLCPKRSIFRASSVLQAKLNHIFPTLFTFPPQEEPRAVIQTDFIIGESLMEFQLTHGVKEFMSKARCPVAIDRAEIQTQMKAAAFSPQPSPQDNGKHYRFTFLGTGSAIPSKYRNVTSIHVELPSGRSILLDAGEGTYGQLWRQFETIPTIDTVFISHNHADHHLGLILLLSKRPNDAEKMIIVGPTPLEFWLREYEQVDGSIRDKYEFKNCANGIYQDDFLTCEAVGVEHCYLSYGFVFQDKDNWKFVFSGDCRPSQELIRVGKDCQVLIHEATLEDSMVQEAKAKKHCTLSEAIQVGVNMNATHTILTHFSQRYPKLPPPSSTTTTTMAFDLLSCTASDRELGWLPSILPTIQQLMTQE